MINRINKDIELMKINSDFTMITLELSIDDGPIVKFEHSNNKYELRFSGVNYPFNPPSIQINGKLIKLVSKDWTPAHTFTDYVRIENLDL